MIVPHTTPVIATTAGADCLVALQTALPSVIVVAMVIASNPILAHVTAGLLDKLVILHLIVWSSTIVASTESAF